MKKIITLTLIVSLLSAMLAVPVSAEPKSQEPYLEIVGYNMVIGDSICLAYAVFAENLPENSNVELLIWDAPQNEYVKGNERIALYATDGKTVIDGKVCSIYVFKNLTGDNGFKHWEMAKEFYSVAHLSTQNGEVYSEVTKYSFVEYAYKRLGKIGNNPSTDEEYKNRLIEILEYGAHCQDANGITDPRNPSKEFYSVNVQGGALSDGFSSGLYFEGESITLVAPLYDGDKIFSHWVDENGSVVGTSLSSEITVKGNVTFTAVYQ